MTAAATYTPQRGPDGRFIRCVHHWRIDAPGTDGIPTPTVSGTCRVCGITRTDFRVSQPETSRFRRLSGRVGDQKGKGPRHAVPPPLIGKARWRKSRRGKSDGRSH